MNITEIQTRVDALSQAMTAKGLREPSGIVHINSHKEPCVGCSWKDAGARYGTAYDYFHAETLSEAFDKAEAMVAAMPSPEEAKFREFMAAVGAAVDLGRQNGIAVEFVNPLVDTMKRLSKNALVFQPAAE